MTALTDHQRDDAADLVRALAAVAGNEDHILYLIERHTENVGLAAALKDCAAALIFTFAECITDPVTLNPNTPAPVNIPAATERKTA